MRLFYLRNSNSNSSNKNNNITLIIIDNNFNQENIFSLILASKTDSKNYLLYNFNSVLIIIISLKLIIKQTRIRKNDEFFFIVKFKSFI